MNKSGIDQIKRQEGYRGKAYKDSLGKWTIGYGFCLDTRILTEKQAEYLLMCDVEDFVKAVDIRWPWVSKMAEPRAWAIYNMAYNMGTDGLSKFKKFLEAAEKGLWADAAREMQDSAWYTQVGKRAQDLQKQMLTGEWVV